MTKMKSDPTLKVSDDEVHCAIETVKEIDRWDVAQQLADNADWKTCLNCGRALAVTGAVVDGIQIQVCADCVGSAVGFYTDEEE